MEKWIELTRVSTSTVSICAVSAPFILLFRFPTKLHCAELSAPQLSNINIWFCGTHVQLLLPCGWRCGCQCVRTNRHAGAEVFSPIIPKKTELRMVNNRGHFGE